LTKQEKKIEDYERVAMLAPECKNEIERIKEEMDKIKEASTETTGERNTITSNLKELREARQDKIQLLLDVLISKVDENYQELTRKSEYVFGRANLYIHDKIDPFKAGIDYIPNPPGKRSIYSV
jgi:chromosome segregation ATPase